MVDVIRDEANKMQVMNDLCQTAHGMGSHVKKKTVKNVSDHIDAVPEHDVFCICPSCGERVLRSHGTHCYHNTCPVCSVTMVRDWRH